MERQGRLVAVIWQKCDLIPKTGNNQKSVISWEWILYIRIELSQGNWQVHNTELGGVGGGHLFGSISIEKQTSNSI